MITDIIKLGSTIGGIIDKFVTDPNQAGELKKQMQDALADNAKAQLEVNKVEAAHRSIFVAGWRPMVGWVLALALAFMYLIKPIVSTALIAFGQVEAGNLINAVELDTGVLMTLLTGMLGFGGFRSIEKIKGISK